MTMRPFGISVVIPAFRRQEELRRAIASVGGDPATTEIIVVDDASPEDLRPMLPLQNDHGVSVRAYRLGRNRGPQAARNLGMRRARFSHIAFLDSDDIFLPDKADRVLQALDGGRIDVLLHGVRGMERYARLARVWRRYFAWIPLRWLASIYNPVTPDGLVVRRNGRLGFERLRHCEDYAFLLHYLDAEVCVRFLDQDLALMHRPPGTAGGLSGDRWKMRKGEFTARRVLLRRPTPGNIGRYLIGTAFGCLRIANDCIRGRYF